MVFVNISKIYRNFGNRCCGFAVRLVKDLNIVDWTSVLFFACSRVLFEMARFLDMK